MAVASSKILVFSRTRLDWKPGLTKLKARQMTLAILVNPADWHPLVVGGQRMQGVHDFRVRGVSVIVCDIEIYVFFMLSVNAGAVLQSLFHVLFLGV